MQIKIYIENSDNNLDELLYEENTLIFYFKSLDSYKDFRRSFYLEKTFIDQFENPITIGEILTSENIPTSKLKKLFNREKPIIIYKEYNQDIFKIKVPVIIDLSNEPLDKKIEILTNNLGNENLFFRDEYTDGEYVPLKDMLRMYQIILNEARAIKENNYSELEALYFIYCNAKKRVYKSENKNDKYFISRSLNHVLNGEKIVCSGYANYIKAMCDAIGIKSQSLTWKNRSDINNGHEENIVFVNDPKYKVLGMFTIDATWDSKRNDTDTSYEKSIKHFLVPLVIDEQEKTVKGFKDPADNSYFSLLSNLKRLENLKEMNAPIKIINNEEKLIRKKINKIYEYLRFPLMSESEDIHEEIMLLSMFSRKKIPLTTLENIIYSITPMSDNELKNTVKSSYHYKFAEPEEKLTYDILKRNIK